MAVKGYGVADYSNLIGANTTFTESFDAVFDLGESKQTFEQFSMEIGVDGVRVTLTGESDLSEVHEQVDGEQIIYGGDRAYAKSADVKTYYAAKRLGRKTVDLDRSGNTGRSLSRFMRKNASILNKVVWDVHAANTELSYLGVALINGSQPHGAGGATWSNDAGATLSRGLFLSGLRSFWSLRKENGDYFEDLEATHLRVSVALYDAALDLLKADRSLAVDASGAEASSSAVSNTTVQNTRAGAVILEKEVRMASTDWQLEANSTPEGRHWFHGFARGITPHEASPDDPIVRNFGLYEWKVDTDFVHGANSPYTIFGYRA